MPANPLSLHGPTTEQLTAEQPQSVLPSAVAFKTGSQFEGAKNEKRDFPKNKNLASGDDACCDGGSIFGYSCFSFEMA
jgi:hypothetical protein